MKEEHFVEWKPDWSPDQQKLVDEAVRDLRQQISALKALRLQLGLSQAELSEILETTQSNVSKMEARGETRLSVLRKLIEHKGGKLRLVAEFDGKELDLAL